MDKTYGWKISGFDHPDMMSFTESKTQITDTWFFDVIKILQEKLKFRHEVVHPIPLSLGKKESNGSYSGMIGQVVNKVADMTGIPLVIQKEIPVDYSTIVLIDPVRFIVMERKMESDWKTVSRPFSFQLWIAIGVSIVLLGIILRLIINCGKNIKRCKKFWSVEKTITFLLATFSLQGSNLNSIRENSSRISIGVWLLSISVLGFSYAGILISFLTAPIYEPLPRTIHELATAVKNGEYSCGSLPDGVPMFLQGSESAEINILKNYIDEHEEMMMLEPSAIVEKMKNERYAFIGPEIYIRGRVMSSFRGKTYLSEETFVTFLAAYLLKKDFPYKDAMNNIIFRLIETGIIKRITEKEYPIIPEIVDKVKPLKLEELAGSFVLLLLEILQGDRTKQIIIMEKEKKNKVIKKLIQERSYKQLNKDSFDKKFYTQTEGIPMGTCIGPKLAEITMTQIDEKIKNIEGVEFYSRKEEKYDITEEKGIVCSFDCNCNSKKTYIGETKRKLKIRLSEHIRAIKGNYANSAVADHCNTEGCAIDLNTVKIRKKEKKQL
ncbi:probable glutamate receptor [Centruroides vittatus]|uniref:probable glutamate receptor n=1 Tax=Centruroides vittatus TaxID=120091 RepID=UPI00350FC1EA